MNGILISVRPQHVMNILNRDKILEIRKTMPKCELPCKVYIYCTKDRHLANVIDKSGSQLFACCNSESAFICGGYLGNGKVVAEFTLNKIDKLEYRHLSVSHTNAYIPVSADADYQWEKHCCVDYGSIVDYGKFAPLYAWHIDDLKIYNKPKELSDFTRLISEPFETWHYNHREKLKRPPQSWCYVEVNNESIQL